MTKLHPGYYKNAILGVHSASMGQFSRAFIDELHLICQITQGMNRPPLFREDYGESGKR